MLLLVTHTSVAPYSYQGLQRSGKKTTSARHGASSGPTSRPWTTTRTSVSALTARVYGSIPRYLEHFPPTLRHRKIECLAKPAILTNTSPPKVRHHGKHLPPYSSHDFRDPAYSAGLPSPLRLARRVIKLKGLSTKRVACAKNSMVKQVHLAFRPFVTSAYRPNLSSILHLQACPSSSPCMPAFHPSSGKRVETRRLLEGQTHTMSVAMYSLQHPIISAPAPPTVLGPLRHWPSITIFLSDVAHYPQCLRPSAVAAELSRRHWS
ncbi:hypothetical protein LZ30DRAFT_332064 [Colletotrichum cereale]|nr:hypothetical protein LZ30DRAFT_332064 [Colletotrichum cereale]